VIKKILSAKEGTFISGILKGALATYQPMFFVCADVELKQKNKSVANNE
jgi:hypothetical protein